MTVPLEVRPLVLKPRENFPVTNWISAEGFFEERDGKMLWIDGGPPATPKVPALSERRFYRVLRKP